MKKNTGRTLKNISVLIELTRIEMLKSLNYPEALMLY